MDENTIPTTMTNDRTTIVCCVERGHLESQTLLMLEMLRRWGGPLGQSRVLAVIPRRDRRLAPGTIRGLESLGAELHDGSPLNRMPWYKWYAKVVAALVAEREATTPVITWLDSDVLVFGSLFDLGLPRGDDFTARREWLGPTMLHESSPHREFWDFACEKAGIDRELITWLPADGPSPRQSLCFNAGVYAFRRGLGLGEAYDHYTRLLMRTRVSCDDGVFWWSEQIGLMFAMLGLNLKFRELPRSENHMVFGPEPIPSMEDARLVHYSPRMFPRSWRGFMEQVKRERPEFHDWLWTRGPIPPSRLAWNPLHMARKAQRKIRWRLRQRQCVRAAEAWRASRTVAPTVGALARSGAPAGA